MGIIARQSLKGTIVNYIGAFIGFISTMFIVTRFLSSEEIGLTRVLFEAATFIGTFAQLGITSSAIRFFPSFKSKDGNNHGFFFYMMMVPLVGCLIFLPFFGLLQDVICDYFKENSSLFVDYYDWLIPLMFFVVYLGVFETYANLLMRIVIPKVIREIVIRLLLIVVYLLYAFHVINLTGFVTGYVAVYGVAMLCNFFYVSKIGSVTLKHDSSFINKDLRKDILKYTLFLMIGVIGGSITSRLDIFMVSAELGLNYAGIYSIAFYMVAIIDIPSRSITAISSPVAADALRAGEFERANDLYKKVALHQLLIGGFIFLILWINIDNIFAIIPQGDIYKEGKWVVFYIGLSRLIIMFLGFGYTLISFSKYYYWGLYFTFFITLITILTNQWLIPILGISGAAIATLLTCVISHAVQQWLVFVKVKGNPYTKNTFKLILLLILLYGVNCLLPQVDNPWFDGIYRTLIICLMGGIAVYFSWLSEEITNLVNQVLKIKVK